MRRHLDFVIDEVVTIDKCDHQFKGLFASDKGRIDEPDEYQFAAVRTNRPVNLSQADIDQMIDVGRLVRKRGANSESTYVPDERDPHLERYRAYQYILRKIDAAGIKRSEAKIRQLLESLRENFPYDTKYIRSPGHFIRLLRERGTKGDRRLRNMVDRHHPIASRLDPEVQKIRAEKVEEYWDNIKLKPMDTWFAIAHAVNARNEERLGSGLPKLVAPHNTNIWRYIRKTENQENTRRRIGKKAADAIWEPIKGSLTAERILDVALFDHTVLDVWVIDDETGVPVGRPHMGYLIDVFSKYPIGFYIGFENPSLYSVMATIKCAVKSKGWINEQYPDIQGIWLPYGRPRKIIVDCALETKGSSFVDACDDAYIEIEWAPMYTPQYKGLIERTFGTFNTQFWHKLPGAVQFKPDILKKYGIDPSKEAVLKLSQLREAFCQYIIEIYGRSPHRGLDGKAPEQVWKEQEPVDLIPTALDMAKLELAFGRVVDATLSREGVMQSNLVYRDETVVRNLLQDLLPLESRKNRAAGRVNVKIKVYPDDVAHIGVLNHKSNEYVLLPCTKKIYTKGLTVHHEKVIRKWAEAENMDFQTEADMVNARHRLQDKVNSMSVVRVRDRKGLQRLKPDNDAVSKAVKLLTAATVGATKAQRPENELQTDAISDRPDGRKRAKVPVIKRKAGGKSKTKEGRHPKTPTDSAASTEAAPHHAAQINDELAINDAMAEAFERLRVTRNG